tara:strand:+ start:876 stop:2585 length:1710 start_codon:yes stop_codon:yes gene_type:complete
MATLTGNTIASTYLGVLNVSGAVGADTLEAVTDGAGTSTSLSLSQQRAKITLGTGSNDDFTINDGSSDIVKVEGDTKDVTLLDDLIFISDSAVVKFGADGDTTLLHTDGTGLTLNSTNKLCFNDVSQFVQGSSGTVLSIGATDEIDLTATIIQINGTADINGAADISGALTVGGNIDFNSGTIDLSTQNVAVTLNSNANALNFDSNTLVVDAANNRVGIGTSAPERELDIVGDGMQITRYSTSSGPTVVQIRSRGSSGSPIIVEDGDVLGSFLWRGYDGADYNTTGARITGYVDGAPGENDLTAAIGFYADNNNIKMTIRASGNVGIGTEDPDSRLHIKDDDVATGMTDSVLHVECTEVSADSQDVLLWLDWSGDSDVDETARWINFTDDDTSIGRLEGTSTQIDEGFTQESDVRYKKNIVDTALKGLETLNKVKVRDFEWNAERGAKFDGKKEKAGFIADELYEVYPEATRGVPGAMKTKVTPAVEAVVAVEAVEAKDAILDDDGNIVEEAVKAISAIEAVEAVPEKTEEVIDAMGVMKGAFTQLLIKAVQELSAKVEALEGASVASL